jgi:gamma-glutamyltranspeptidase/glutathione hydrolase
MKLAAISGALALMTSTSVFAADLSPAQWPAQERQSVENLEAKTWTPPKAQTVSGGGGIVSATVSPIAVYAGVQTLKAGGDAADAAATVALTQITTQLGSVVSYAGIFTMLYYDAKTHHVYSMDAGYNSYLGEHDPKTIPIADMGPLNIPGRIPTQGGAKGRETLVPGFMAGLEAMHQRFGRLPFKDLFAPAIYYDEHGVRISGPLFGFFKIRQTALARTPEGRAFMAQAGGTTPAIGALFVQPELAATLKAVSEQGSAYMYTGLWGQDFVRLVQREGGKVTAEDMARYRPIWSEPYKDEVFGHTVYVNGPPHLGAANLIPALNLAEALRLNDKGPYWSDPQTFQDLALIDDAISGAPELTPAKKAFLNGKGIDASARNQMTKAYAAQVAPLLKALDAAVAETGPHHSNAIVVVDKDGNIAAITHTINAVIWGDTGIVVDGVPIPDSATFQQQTLAAMKPGDRVPHEILDTISFDGDKPVLATGSIGSSLVPETIRVLVGVLGQHQDLQTVMAAPPLLVSFGQASPDHGVPVEQEAYAPAFITKLKAMGITIDETSPATTAGLRGTLAAVAIDPASGTRSAADQPGVMVFNGAE